MRPGARLGAAALLLAGCGADETTGGPPPPTPVDSVLVGVLTDIGLAEARAGLAPAERRGAVRDSLRAVALDAHGMRASEFERAEARLANDPTVARATYDAVDRALTGERFGTPATEAP